MAKHRRLTQMRGTPWAPSSGVRFPTQLQDDSAKEHSQNLLAWASMLERASEDPEWFTVDSALVKTWDKADREFPYKPLPENMDYLRLMIRWWIGNDRVAFAKSRDVIATLTLCLLHLHAGMFLDGSELIAISDKAEKSEHNLGRMLFAYRSLPPAIRQMIPMQASKGTSGDPRIMRFLERPPLWPGGKPFVGSKIEAIPSGPEQIQEYHPTMIFFDQVETTKNLRETLGAILPIIKPGTKITLLGTPCPGVWEEICMDRLEMTA